MYRRMNIPSIDVLVLLVIAMRGSRKNMFRGYFCFLMGFRAYLWYVVILAFLFDY